MTSIVSNTWNSVINWQTGKSKNLEALDRQKVASAIDEYNSLFKEDTKEAGHSVQKIEERKAVYATMINHYYDLVTDFYEYGWGQCFHFAPRFQGEDFHASLARHEHYLSARLGLTAGMVALDAGCGVGGPMRAISRFSGAKVIGVNNNDYQIKRSNILNQEKKLAHLCNTVKGDFMNLPFEEGTFDAVYAIEATCHAPDKVACYSQMFKVLKPGACFAGYEWCMTDKYNPKNPEHRLIKHGIEKGDSLPDLVHPSVVIEALEKSGFEVVDSFDVAAEAPKIGNDVGWYETLQGGWKLSQIKHSKWGRFLTQRAVEVMETVRIAPKGTSETHRMLSGAADALAQGGELGIFTPMYFFIARKPADK